MDVTEKHFIHLLHINNYANIVEQVSGDKKLPLIVFEIFEMFLLFRFSGLWISRKNPAMFQLSSKVIQFGHYACQCFLLSFNKDRKAGLLSKNRCFTEDIFVFPDRAFPPA